MKPLDTATKDRLLEAAISLSAEDAEIVRVGREQGLSPADYGKLRDENFHQFEKKVAALLGPDEARQFVDLYVASRFVPIAQDFARRCADEGAPLARETVATIAVTLSKSLDNPEYPMTPVILPNGRTVPEDNALKAAERVLTSKQLELFKKLWAEHPYPGKQ